MDKLRQYLMPILKDIESRYVWVFEVAELEYLTHYFHALGRYPSPMEVIFCAMLHRPIYPAPMPIPGHKIDAFYAQPTVIETPKPDLLDTPEIPSDIKPSNRLLGEEMLDEEAASRARTLMAINIHLPRSVVAILEDKYWIENHYTHRPGYHHYEHSEGESCYALSFGHSNTQAEFSSNSGFIGMLGSDFQSMSDTSSQWMNDANQAAFPLLCSWFYKAETSRCVGGGFANVLPYPGEIQKIKPGDRLFLLGKPSDQRNMIVENQFQSVIFNAYALGEKNPVIRAFSLEKKSLVAAVIEALRQSIPGSGIHIHLDFIPKPYEGWTWEDFWRQPLQSTCLVVVPDYQKHVFHPIVNREACACIEVGEVTELGNIVFVGDDQETPLVDVAWEFLEHFPERPIALSIQNDNTLKNDKKTLNNDEDFSTELEAMLQSLPVSDKSVFLTQMDRTCTGLVARDSMVGPWQVPVADVAVTATEFKDYLGEAMAVSVCSLGEDEPVSMVRKALNEVMTNLAAAAIRDLSDVHLMIPRGILPMDIEQQLKSWVELLGISIREDHSIEPLQYPFFWVAFAPVIDVRKTLTPQWVMDDETELMAVIWDGKTSEDWKSFFHAVQTLNRDDLLLAYHDLSIGGLARCLLEMAFCSHCGFSVNLGNLSPFEPYSGAIIQVRRSSQMEVMDFLNRLGFEGKIHLLGRPVADDQVTFRRDEVILFSGSRIDLHRLWAMPGYDLQKQKGDGVSAHEAYDVILDSMDPGLHETLTFDPNQNIALPYISEEKPSLAILRFPGGRGHLEMAAAFDRVGFECIDVSIMDILNGEDDLKQYAGLAIGGSEIEGNNLPLAVAVQESSLVRKVFEQFFQRPHTFTLGTGYGCQWLAQIKAWIPGTDHWPSFQGNVSGQFESRWALVEVRPSNSVFLEGMEGSFIPIPVACRHGRSNFSDLEVLKAAEDQQLLPLAYVNHYEQMTEQYPFNPTGSPLGACGFISRDGRVLGVMGHPERAFRSSQQGWHHRYLQMDAPWLRLFRNAKKFVG